MINTLSWGMKPFLYIFRFPPFPFHPKSTSSFRGYDYLCRVLSSHAERGRRDKWTIVFVVFVTMVLDVWLEIMRLSWVTHYIRFFLILLSKWQIRSFFFSDWMRHSSWQSWEHLTLNKYKLRGQAHTWLSLLFSFLIFTSLVARRKMKGWERKLVGCDFHLLSPRV